MTNEEAIKRLKSDIYKYSDFTENPNENEFWTAFDMAIKALEKEFCEDISEDGTLTVNVEDGNKVSRVLVCGDNHFGGLYYPEQQPCEDAISAAEAISRIEVRRKITCESDPYDYEKWIKGYEEGIDDAIAMINSVPPVTPQPKTGRWILYRDHKNMMDYPQCDNCGAIIKLPLPIDNLNFCPNCGRKMEEEV